MPKLEKCDRLPYPKPDPPKYSSLPTGADVGCHRKS